MITWKSVGVIVGRGDGKEFDIGAGGENDTPPSKSPLTWGIGLLRNVIFA
jgi:hypothetical protein